MVFRCSAQSDYVSGLYDALNGYVSDKDARIGVAVIIDGKDTVAVNGSEDFPMMSVYKFPIALTMADYCRKNKHTLDYCCIITQDDMRRDTYSPMLKKYAGIDTARIKLRELLAYSLQMSDNNASDIILKELKGVGLVNKYIESLGIDGIKTRWTEEDMHEDINRSYDNTSTPLAMAELFDVFDKKFNDSISIEIKQMMETCTTGSDRLVAPLKAANAVVGHKTGTGFVLPDGRLMALNDCGYVHLSDGCRYSIAVFIADSGYDTDKNSRMIAEISQIVFNSLGKNNIHSTSVR